MAASRAARLTIDRFEGELAVVQAGDLAFDLPRWMLPAHAREGDVLAVRIESGDFGETILRLTRDARASEEARASVRAGLQALRSRDPGGNLEL